MSPHRARNGCPILILGLVTAVTARHPPLAAHIGGLATGVTSDLFLVPHDD